MTHACCTTCRHRFGAAASAHLPACPECGGSLSQLETAEELLGFRLYTYDDSPDTWLAARAIELALPDPSAGGS